MGHGADRTLMAGNLGIVGVYVDCLDDAGEGNEEDAQQRQSCEVRVFARLVSRLNQTERPISMLILPKNTTT